LSLALPHRYPSLSSWNVFAVLEELARYTRLAIVIISAIALFVMGVPSPYARWTYGVWAGIIFGGPLLYWFLAISYVEDEDKDFAERVRAPMREKIEDLKLSLSRSESHQNDLQYELENARSIIEQLKQNEKAKEEKKLEAVKKKGILDSEDF
jgi:hypothetical protein